MLSIFDHVKEAWNQRHHPNMLFLFYEELSMDPPAAVQCVANFLGKKLSDEQIAELCEHLSFEKIKSNSSVNYDNFKSFGVFTKEETFIRNDKIVVNRASVSCIGFFLNSTRDTSLSRKVGGWRDYFDEEMTQQAEQWIQHNLKDTDLRFPLM